MTRSFSRYARDYSSPRNLFHAWSFADPVASRCALGASMGDIGRREFGALRAEVELESPGFANRIKHEVVKHEVVKLIDPSRVASFEDATESTKELFK